MSMLQHVCGHLHICTCTHIVVINNNDDDEIIKLYYNQSWMQPLSDNIFPHDKKEMILVKGHWREDLDGLIMTVEKILAEPSALSKAS